MRLFVAVWVPPEISERLAALERPASAGVRWTSREQWHVTLRFLGEVDDPSPVLAALQAADLGAPVQVALGPEAVALSSQVLVLPVGGLDGLAGRVIDATAALGRPPERRPFRGHLTLARRGRGGPPMGRLARLGGLGLDAGFEVDAVAVVRSHLHPDGARYETLAEVPLG